MHLFSIKTHLFYDFRTSPSRTSYFFILYRYHNSNFKSVIFGKQEERRPSFTHRTLWKSCVGCAAPPALLFKRKRSAFGRYSNRCETHIPYTLCLRAVATGSTPSLGLFLRGIPGVNLRSTCGLFPLPISFEARSQDTPALCRHRHSYPTLHAALFRQK